MSNAGQKSAQSKKELIAAEGVYLLSMTFLIGKSEDIIHRTVYQSAFFSKL